MQNRCNVKDHVISSTLIPIVVLPILIGTNLQKSFECLALSIYFIKNSNIVAIDRTAFIYIPRVVFYILYKMWFLVIKGTVWQWISSLWRWIPAFLFDTHISGCPLFKILICLAVAGGRTVDQSFSSMTMRNDPQWTYRNFLSLWICLCCCACNRITTYISNLNKLCVGLIFDHFCTLPSQISV